ncbi:MAG: TonB-dependent receptor [Acidobacteria bacterium]|nr:TonB-dependent receptor [Acidobacteriota bacterium]
MRSGVLILTLLVALPLAAPSPSSAQDPAEGQDAAETGDDEDPPQFTEEISVTVTARKREEDLQSVPFSIVAPTQRALRSRGARSLEDVSTNVAGFSVQNLGPGQSQIAMRGVSAGQVVRDQPGVKEQVGVYLDESVISLSLFTPDIDLFDMSRIEVLRGPQGTLFGSGSLSGTVRYITNPPALGVSEGAVELGFGSLDGGGLGHDAKFAVNIPLGRAAAARVTAWNTGIGGFMDAVQPDLSVNENVNGGRRTGARVALRLQPSERFAVTPRVIYQDVSMQGWNRIDAYNVLANPFTTTRPAVTLGERQLFTQIDEPYTDEFLLGDITLTYDFGGAALTAITSFTNRDVEVVRDASALGASVAFSPFGAPEAGYTLDFPLVDSTIAQGLTQEVRVAGGAERVDWLAGAFYSSSERQYGQSAYARDFVAINGGAVSDFLRAVTGIPDLVWTGSRALAGHADTEEIFYSDLNYDFEQLAAFGEVTLSVTDRLRLTGGLRWYDFDEHRTQVFDGLFADPLDSEGTVRATGVAPRVIASYDVTPATQINAQVSKGFRLGGINDPLNAPICSPADLVTFGDRGTWEDEELWNYEAGVKSTFLGGRGTFNASAFYMDIRNLQATVTAGTCSSRIIFNVPDARSAGVELELAAQPTTFFDFALSASVADARLQSTVSSTDETGAVGVVSGIEAGRRLPTTPRFQSAAAATWRWLVGGGWVGYVSGTFHHVGSRFTQVGDQAEGFGTVDLTALAPALRPGTFIGGPLTQSFFAFDPELPAYNILNLRVGILDGRWDVAFFIDNVTDERALLALDQERGTLARVGYLTNPPRSYGVSTRIDF